MPECAGAEQFTAITGISALLIPAESTHTTRHLPIGGHDAHSCRAQDTNIFVFSVLQHHRCVNGQVICSAEQSRMTRYAAHSEGSWIVNGTAHPLIVALFRRRRTLLYLIAWQKTSVSHAERAENVLLAELVDIFPTDATYELAEHNISHI